MSSPGADDRFWCKAGRTYAGAGLRLSVLDLKFCKLVTAPPPPPESDQHQGYVASMLHHAPELTTIGGGLLT